MKNIILLFVTFTAFAFGYFIIKKLNHLINKNRLQILDTNTGTCSTIRISTENPILLTSAKSTFASYSGTHPYIVFRFGTGPAKHLLRKLSHGSLDIAILSGESIKNMASDLTYFRIPIQSDSASSNNSKIPSRKSLDDPWIYVVWNRAVSSQERDRLLFILENERCHSTCGYCDYLD